MDREQLLTEMTFKASRSSGPGGQHVNKTSTKVLLSWNLEDSTVFSASQKDRLRLKLKKWLSKDGILQLTSEETRSQHKNKERVISKFFTVLEQALRRKKVRKKTTPSKGAKLRRLKAKKVQAEKKANRQKPSW